MKLLEMKCEICGKGLAEGVALIRQNPKGEKGIFHCTVHNAAQVDPEVQAVIDALK